MKNPIFFFILVVFTIVNIADSITAFFILDGEANPIFLLTGSIWPVILLKCVVVGYMWFYWYRNIYASNFVYYILILVSIVGTVMVSFGVWANTQGIMNPELLEASKQIPAEVKMEIYKVTMFWIYIVPMCFCLLSFLVYDKTLKKVTIDKEYFKKWWKL